jgi:hypothetical protein
VSGVDLAFRTNARRAWAVACARFDARVPVGRNRRPYRPGEHAAEWSDVLSAEVTPVLDDAEAGAAIAKGKT